MHRGFGVFGGAAGFVRARVVWSKKGSTQTALTESRPRSVAESLLHVHDVVEWRKDTPCTRIQVVEPFMRDMRVTQVFDSRHQLPRSCGVKCSLQTPQPSPVRQP